MEQKWKKKNTKQINRDKKECVVEYGIDGGLRWFLERRDDGLIGNVHENLV
jgi:hypothetical protein